MFSLTLNSMFSDFLACHIAVGNIDTKTGHMENNYQIPINVRQFFMFFLSAGFYIKYVCQGVQSPIQKVL